jgi:hypothetical protein
MGVSNVLGLDPGVAFPALRKNTERTFIVSGKRSLCENNGISAGIRWPAKECLLSGGISDHGKVPPHPVLLPQSRLAGIAAQSLHIRWRTTQQPLQTPSPLGGTFERAGVRGVFAGSCRKSRPAKHKASIGGLPQPSQKGRENGRELPTLPGPTASAPCPSREKLCRRARPCHLL